MAIKQGLLFNRRLEDYSHAELEHIIDASLRQRRLFFLGSLACSFIGMGFMFSFDTSRDMASGLLGALLIGFALPMLRLSIALRVWNEYRKRTKGLLVSNQVTA